MSKGPARKYSWEPFRKGNEVSTKGGWRSPKKIADRAAELGQRAIEAVPYLGDPAFAEAVTAWLEAEAMRSLMFDYIREQGLLDDAGKPRVSVDWYIRLARLAADLRGRLGLDPTSRARLERELASAKGSRFDLDNLIAEGQRALAQRNEDGDG